MVDHYLLVYFFLFFFKLGNCPQRVKKRKKKLMLTKLAFFEEICVGI